VTLFAISEANKIAQYGPPNEVWGIVVILLQTTIYFEEDIPNRK
jgi:hypothetical protein